MQGKRIQRLRAFTVAEVAVTMALVAVLMAALQVCYRTQNRALDSTREQIVELQ